VLYTGEMSKKDIPDISTKLAAPAKKSLFERQKAEAEAKRLKEQQETAAVYEDFVKSFDNDEDDHGPSSGAFSKRHFTSQPGLGRGSKKLSGPGSLGPSGPPLSRKRPFENSRETKRGIFSYEEEYKDPKTAFQDSDDEKNELSKSRAEERAAPKPTLHLSSLPLGTSTAAVKALMPSNLNVDGVRFLPISDRSSSAIVTLAEGTPAGDLDTAVSALQNKYLGWGFYLSISRHLSSAVTNALPTGLNASVAPFGAKPIQQTFSLSRAPPPRFAPPGQRNPPTQVNVKAPTDLKQLKLIHKTVESIITHGPEFEALLMSRPEIQKEEKWAWIWDSKSEGGVYYRCRLWDVLTNAQQRIKFGRGRNDTMNQTVFDNGTTWAAPEGTLPFEYTTSIEEVVSDSDYDSSEDDDSGDEGRRRIQHLQAGASIPESGAPGETDLPAYLNPLHKAKLVHLLTRLPTTTAKLRRGDVARITSFAISHAGAGADEVVNLLTTNIHRPFNLSHAKALHAEDEPEEEPNAEKEDLAPTKLIALYLLSDILSSSSTSGVRHAWRYRALFEASLRAHKTFEHLGRLEKDLSWGKLRAEKWKRSVISLLSLWEGWCVFPAKAQEEFVEAFTNPPLTTPEREAVEREEREKAEREKFKRWKAVGQPMQDVQDEEMNDVDGEALADEDLDGEPMEDVDGEPMADEDEDDEDVDGEPMAMDQETDIPPEKEQVVEKTEKEQLPPPTGLTAAESRKRRPRAEDMFADSDGE
jgi:U2-associated protein SR140